VTENNPAPKIIDPAVITEKTDSQQQDTTSIRQVKYQGTNLSKRVIWDPGNRFIQIKSELNQIISSMQHNSQLWPICTNGYINIPNHSTDQTTRNNPATSTGGRETRQAIQPVPTGQKKHPIRLSEANLASNHRQAQYQKIKATGTSRVR
jgi:hypothetical protein